MDLDDRIKDFILRREMNDSVAKYKKTRSINLLCASITLLALDIIMVLAKLNRLSIITLLIGTSIIVINIYDMIKESSRVITEIEYCTIVTRYYSDDKTGSCILDMNSSTRNRWAKDGNGHCINVGDILCSSIGTLVVYRDYYRNVKALLVTDTEGIEIYDLYQAESLYGNLMRDGGSKKCTISLEHKN